MNSFRSHNYYTCIKILIRYEAWFMNRFWTWPHTRANRTILIIVAWVKYETIFLQKQLEKRWQPMMLYYYQQSENCIYIEFERGTSGNKGIGWLAQKCQCAHNLYIDYGIVSLKTLYTLDPCMLLTVPCCKTTGRRVGGNGYRTGHSTDASCFFLVNSWNKTKNEKYFTELRANA